MKKRPRKKTVKEKEVLRQMLPAKKHPRPDLLLPELALDKSLPPELSAKIASMSKSGIRRSQIARELGIPKIHVVQELIRIGG